MTQQFQALPVRQSHVRDDQMKRLALQRLQGLLHRACALDVVALAQQGEFIQGQQVRLVIDDEQAVRVRRHHRGPQLEAAAEGPRS